MFRFGFGRPGFGYDGGFGACVGIGGARFSRSGLWVCV